MRKTAGFMRASLSAMALFLMIGGAYGQASMYPDSLWVQVIFYDYWVDNNGTNPDFEVPYAPGGLVKTGMVADTLDAQRKPVPMALACEQVESKACNLDEWFRVSGNGGSDNTAKFVFDSVNFGFRRCYWTTASGGSLTPFLGKAGEFIGPNYNSTYNMRNIVIYDSLPFLHLGKVNPAKEGVYEYKDDDFFKLDGRGFGAQPTTNNPLNHNYGFAMELHTTFTFRKGLLFTFKGDDDTWVFINGKKAIDLGGIHGSLDGTVNLDTIPGLVEGQKYPIDFFYAERHTLESRIQITTNVIAATCCLPSLRISLASDTVCAGDSVTIIGTLVDSKGKTYPELSDQITWSYVPGTNKPGDTLSSVKNDTTVFHGIYAWRSVSIVGTYRSGTQTITATSDIFIRDCGPGQLDIVQQSVTQLSAEQVRTGVNLNTTVPRLTIAFDSDIPQVYLYAVLRDKYGNFMRLADSSSWSSLHADIATATATTGKVFEGVVSRTPGALRESTQIIVSQGGHKPDTAFVQLRPCCDMVIAMRIVNAAIPEVKLDEVRMSSAESMTIKVQGQWVTRPGVWVDITGLWSMNPDTMRSDVPIPANMIGTWTYKPVNPGRSVLSVKGAGIGLPTISVSVPVIITAPLASIKKVSGAIPSVLSLSAAQNASAITVSVGLPQKCTSGTVTLFSLSGKKLVEKEIAGPGWHTITLDNVPGGAHLLRLNAGGRTILRKVPAF